MKRLVLSSVIFFFYAANLFPQSKFSASASVGIIDAFGRAEGIEMGFKQPVTDHLSFQFGSAYYGWSLNNDLNANQSSAGKYVSSLDYHLHHVKVEVNSLIPIRMGFNYSVGSLPSHPFFGIEWTLNIISKSNFFPQPVVDTSVPFVVTYSKINSRDVFVSLGFDLGYSFYLTNEMNATAGIKYQVGKLFDYVAFVGGVEYQF